MARLKDETAALHERTESVVPVMREGLDLARYADVLARFVALYGPLEEALAAGGAADALGIDLVARMKAPALRRDLRTLYARGVIAPRHEVRGALPLLRDASDALGVLYVLEGATLGGSVTMRHLAPRLALTADAGGAFYSVYGERLGAMWREFGAAADRYAREHPGGDAATIESACATFEAIIRQFA